MNRIISGMSQHIDAIFIDGVFRPQQPVDLAEGVRVSLTVESTSSPSPTPDDFDDLSDIDDLLDHEYVEECRRRLKGVVVPSLEEVRRMLSVYEGNLADDISAERDER